MKTEWYKVGLGALMGAAFLFPQVGEASTTHHRVIWDQDPSANAVISFSPDGSSNSPYLMYGYSTDESTWTTQSVNDTQIFNSSLTNHFVRLGDLNADSAVYYRVCDDSGCGQRFWFKTAAVDNTAFVAVAGGDTRTGWDTRRAGNTLIAKIRPLFVMHGGDFTDSNNASQMNQFLTDWALSYSDDTIDGKSYKRIYPLVPTHGNHEDNNYRTMCQVFGADYDQDGTCTYHDTYGAFNVSPLLRVYTLNSQFKNSGMSSYATAMNNWLSSDLAANEAVTTWRFAQYHKPMFPHYTGKSENQILHDWWADDFYAYAMNLVIESDTHITKVTKAVVPSGSNFTETTSGGTVYVGEGSWGAPARSANDPKSWTIDLASIQQFKVITVSQDNLEISTAQFDASASTVTREERAADPVVLPVNVNWWQANGIGETMTLTLGTEGRSIIETDATGEDNITALTASDDTFISRTQSDSNFNGSSEGLLADGSDSTYGEMMILVTFDMNALPECSIVESASIELDVFNYSPGSYEIFTGVNSWNEASATWNSVGGVSQKDTLVASFNPSTTGLKSVALGQAGIDAVNAWVQGNNNGIIIASGDTPDGIDVYSKEMGTGLLLKVTYHIDNGCSQPVNVAPSAAFSFNSNDLTVTLTDSSVDSDGSIASWDWDFGDGSTSETQNPSHIYTTAGTYTVNLTVIDNDGAANSTNQSVTVSKPVSQSPAAPTNLTALIEKSGKGKNKVVTAIVLSWSDNADNETNFVIEGCEQITSGKGKNKIVTCDYAEAGNVDANVKTLSLDPSTSNDHFRVKAVNGIYESSYSNELKL